MMVRQHHVVVVVVIVVVGRASPQHVLIGSFFLFWWSHCNQTRFDFFGQRAPWVADHQVEVTPNDTHGENNKRVELSLAWRVVAVRGHAQEGTPRGGSGR